MHLFLPFLTKHWTWLQVVDMWEHDQDAVASTVGVCLLYNGEAMHMQVVGEVRQVVSSTALLARVILRMRYYSY